MGLKGIKCLAQGRGSAVSQEVEVVHRCTCIKRIKSLSEISESSLIVAAYKDLDPATDSEMHPPFLTLHLTHKERENCSQAGVSQGTEKHVEQVPGAINQTVGSKPEPESNLQLQL